MPTEIPGPDTTVLTVNQRLARELRGGYARRRIEAGLAAWESPDVLTFGAWLDRCWRELEERAEGGLPMRLSGTQERALWEEVLHADGGVSGRGTGQALLQPAAAARSAQEAHDLLGAYRCPLEDPGEAVNDDVGAFRRWAKAFRRTLRERGWIDTGAARERLIPALRDRRRDRRIELPRRVLLAGIDESAPREQAILDALAEAGVEIGSWPSPDCAGHASRTVLEQAQDELEAAARWARSLLEAEPPAPSGLPPETAVPLGIVVPDLGERREMVERVFEDALCPAAVLPGAEGTARPFNLSLGAPLGRVPPVRHALLVLGLARARIPLAEIGELLASPYLGGGESERLPRAVLDAALRESAPPEISLGALRGFLRRRSGAATHADACPVLAQGLEDLARGVREARARREAAAWAGVFSGWLRCLGWPGERGRDSAEYQAVDAFSELLAAFSNLGPVLRPQGADEARSRLLRLAAERVFQPASESAPVQILGTLEAVGLRFSRLWICGLHDRAWPPAPRPNPFIPVALQRRLGMPHASPERELEFARRVTERLLGAAPEVVVSHPAREGDEDLRPSPLIAHLPPIFAGDLPAASAPSLARRLQAAAPGLESLADERAPALTPDESVRGGARVFQDQAACPFRAFAVHRLGARALEEPVAGPDARVRGILAHRLLELVWAELGSHARLLAAPEEELASLVERHVRRALEEAARDRPDTFRDRFLALEAQRLRRLALEWLDIERGRAPFEVVGPEREHRARVGGVELRLRLDRIDRLPGGRLVLLDYKTGRTGLAGWFGPRPDEPQLPLYCSVMAEPVAAVAFASLRRGELGFKGLGEVEGIAPGIRTLERHRRGAGAEHADWEELQCGWRGTLEALGRAFVEGDARVDPKIPGRTCEYCDMGPLCRIHERVSWSAWEEGGEGEPGSGGNESGGR